MTTVALVFAGLAALLHVYIWTMESLTWRKPATWKRFGVASQEEAELQATLAFNQGYYNLFLALIAACGIFHVIQGGRYEPVGWALVVAATASMLGASIVLRSCGKEYTRPAVLQGTFPLLTLVLVVLAHT